MPATSFADVGSGFGARMATGSRKSLRRALLYSAILPGWGEYYLGHKTRAKFFFAAEAIGWIGLASFGTYANWRENDFIRFAADKANADLSSKDDFFFDMVGFYQDTDDYNARGRVSDPDRPYFADNAANHWRWQTSQDQAAYRHLKDRAREADRRADFMIGALLLNRVVSMIDAVYHARRQNRGEAFGHNQSPSYHLAVEPDLRRQEVRLSLSARF
ncbi:MAG: DUF5683 domain-containing protein [Candidatus Zixiibacteriota bacterium]